MSHFYSARWEIRFWGSCKPQTIVVAAKSTHEAAKEIWMRVCRGWVCGITRFLRRKEDKKKLLGPFDAEQVAKEAAETEIV